MASIDDVLAAARDETARREAVAKVLLRQDLAQRHAELDAELQEALAAAADQMDRPEHVRALAEQVKALETKIESELVEFRFRAVSARVWADLLAKYPPTKAQREQNQYVRFDMARFPAAAVAASCVEPAMSERQAVELSELLPSDQWTLLWGTCALLNEGGDSNPKSVAAGLILRANGASGRPVTTTGSDVPIS